MYMLRKFCSKLSLFQFILLMMLIGIFAVNLVGCGSKDESGNNRTEKVKEGGLEFSMALPEGDFKVGKSIPVSLLVKNVGSQIEILHYNTGQRFDVEVKDSAGKALWRWSQGQVFAQSLEQTKLKPDDSEDDEAVWSQKDAVGNQVPAGSYTLTAKSTADEISKTVSLKIKVVK